LFGVLIGFFAASLKTSQDNNIRDYLIELGKKYYRMEEISYILGNEYYDETFLE
jgi:hypothetical protein